MANFFQERELSLDILATPVEKLHSQLNGPTLFFLKGLQEQPLVISTLLHGDEHTGFLSLKQWLSPYLKKEKKLPRSLWILIGNTKAAEKNLRHLSDQPDFNRIWSEYNGPEKKEIQELIIKLRSKNIFAVIDIHNNTGKNPHYACVSKWEKRDIQLASLFSRIVVFAEQPRETFSRALSPFAPSVTIECGLSGESLGVDKTVGFLEALIHLNHLDFHHSPQEICGYETIARMKVVPEVKIEFTDKIKENTISLLPNLDNLNFSELSQNTLIGKYSFSNPPVIVEDCHGKKQNHYLLFKNNEITLKEALTPAMLTLSEKAIRSDCLGYLMKRKN